MDSELQTFPIAAGERLPAGRTAANTRAVYTGVKHPPRAGEWYLSGAIVEAYRAPSDLSWSFHIAELVAAQVTTTWVPLGPATPKED